MEKMFLPIISSIQTEDLTVALVGYVIVFAALVLLFLIFSNIPKLMNYFKMRQLKKEGEKEKYSSTELDVQAEVTAAISTALHLYFNELHDEESNVLTIKKVSKTYSPWSSKIYNVQNYPTKK